MLCLFVNNCQKPSENLTVVWWFQGVEKRCIWNNEVKLNAEFWCLYFWYIYKKAGRKLNDSARMAPFIGLSRCILTNAYLFILINAFFRSQFNYCSLVWISHGCKNNRKISRLYDRCLYVLFTMINGHRFWNY